MRSGWKFLAGYFFVTSHEVLSVDPLSMFPTDFIVFVDFHSDAVSYDNLFPDVTGKIRP